MKSSFSHAALPQPTASRIEALPFSVDTHGLSALIHRAPNTIYADVVRRPHTLPPSISVAGGKRIWLVETVLQWLKERQQVAPQPEFPSQPRCKRGRRTKAEQIARARLVGGAA
jgi:hypothetical protein